MNRSKTLLAGAAIAALVTLGSTSAFASPNLISNGSFEKGLADWTVSGTETQGYPPVVIDGTASPYPAGAFSEAIPADNAASLSPDAAGTHSLYFVSDFSDGQTVSQDFTVTTAGRYNLGFDYYVPANGAKNPVDATFTASIGGVQGEAQVSALPVTTWTAASTQTYLQAGSYSAAFSFYTDGDPAKDIVIDKVYVTSAVPEPATWAVMLTGFGAMGATMRASRRKRAQAATA